MLRFEKPTRGPAALFAFLFLSTLAFGQTPTITQVIPAAASAGDLVIIEGQNLGGVTAIEIAASDSGGSFFPGVGGGGFAFSFSVTVPPTSVAIDRLTFIAPTPFSAAPSSADPLGTLKVTTGTLDSSSSPFLLLPLAGPEVKSVGQGSLQSTGQGAPVTSFAPAAGRPFLDSNDPTFAIFNVTTDFLVQNAVPGSTAILIASLDAPSPSVSINGGLLAIDPAAPILLGETLVGPDGTGSVPVTLAPGFYSFEATLQYLVVDFGLAPLPYALAKGLQVTL